MDQDVALGVTMTITQADLPFLREAGRLGEFPVVYRVHRQQKGGGYGDQTRHPFAWGILVYVDGQLARVNSARGLGREWNDLDRAEKWLRSQGFWYWWTRNDLEAIHTIDEGASDGTAIAGDLDASHTDELAPIEKSKFSLK
ncbi:hypothetical protein [Kordiimonas sp. SCSIO 12610]|uniref:hypothetical protein n=1 Tax=Kordiimonas sp. SCSIO 12610 TaxID=2829597 RepID=UPI00210A880B|nr:hypothetical protein [Kordiimonas sp. SCSIO 12610]UTW54730.1 hypothetical protein KFF44_13090 [Kordiimonas sp. SCSIO 12610]